MSLDRGFTITIRRTPAPDQWGDPTGTPTEHTITGCGIAPRTAGVGGSSRDISGRNREGILEGFTILHDDPRIDVLHTDEVILPAPYGSPGEVFAVDGEVGRWISPIDGWEAGCEFAVRRAAG